jgi:hypothetical protein
MHFIRTLVAVLAAACAVQTASAATLQPWTTYQGNAAHTGYVPVKLDASQFTKAWNTTLPMGLSLQQVTQANGVVYASQNGYFSGQGLYALSSTTGSILWGVSFPNTFSVNPPAVDSGKVYVQTVNNWGDTWLRAYDATTGTQAFQAPAEAQWERYLAPTIVDGTVYADGGTYGGMYSFNGTTGARNWFTPLNQYDQWTPAVDGQNAYAYIGYAGLEIISRSTGARVTTISDPYFSWNGYSMNQAPVLGGQNDAIAFNGGRLISFDLAAYTIRWQQQINAQAQPSVANGVIYLIADGRLSARSQSTGVELWSWLPTNGEGLVATPVVVTDSHVFVQGTTSTFAIDLAAHIPAWQYPATGAMSLSEGALYIAGTDGTLTAIGTPSAPTAGGGTANLSLALLASTGVNSGAPTVLDARVQNAGPAIATKIVLTVNLPTAFSVQSMSTGCTIRLRTVTCNYAGLGVNQTLDTLITVVPSKRGTYVVSGSVTAAESDPFSRNNKAAIKMTVY